jgi:hypothetical protein
MYLSADYPLFHPPTSPVSSDCLNGAHFDTAPVESDRTPLPNPLPTAWGEGIGNGCNFPKAALEDSLCPGLSSFAPLGLTQRTGAERLSRGRPVMPDFARWGWRKVNHRQRASFALVIGSSSVAPTGLVDGMRLSPGRRSQTRSALGYHLSPRGGWHKGPAQSGCGGAGR